MVLKWTPSTGRLGAEQTERHTGADFPSVFIIPASDIIHHDTTSLLVQLVLITSVKALGISF